MPRPVTRTARWQHAVLLGLTAVRLAALVPAVALLYWVGEILDNIWGYNDSGALAYLVFAAIPGVAGVLLLWFVAAGPGYWRLRVDRGRPRSP